MKPITKKTIIIVVAVLVIALIVWLVFFRKKGWEKELSKLTIPSDAKKNISIKVKEMLNDPSFDKAATEAEASQYGMTYDQWLICLAAMQLGYNPESTNGTISITYPQG